MKQVDKKSIEYKEWKQAKKWNRYFFKNYRIVCNPAGQCEIQEKKWFFWTTVEKLNTPPISNALHFERMKYSFLTYEQARVVLEYHKQNYEMSLRFDRRNYDSWDKWYDDFNKREQELKQKAFQEYNKCYLNFYSPPDFSKDIEKT